jgi:hypothetical protein
LPSLAAAIAASIVSWMIDAVIEPYVGIGTRIFISLIDSTLVYFYFRRWMINLRDGL